MFYETPKDETSGIVVLTADRGRCPVCGDAHGDCKGETSYAGGVTFVPRQPVDPGATFRVPRRIYESTEVNGKVRRRLLYPMGAAITPEEAKRLGLIPK